MYCSTTLTKALGYAAHNKYDGVVLKLKVDLGQCLELKPGDPLTRKWQQFYDSAFAPAGTVNQDFIIKKINILIF